MERKEAIKQAVDKLVNDRELTAILNRTNEVRIPVLLPLPAKIPSGAPSNESAPVVIFTLEKTFVGYHLMAEFNGQKEFVA